MSSPPSPRPALLRPPSFHPATVQWAPGGQQRYLVVNPMHIITLQDRTKTFAVRVVEKIKSFSERWFSHILLLMFLLIYACLGALLFHWLEAPREQGEKISINRTREMVIEHLWSEIGKLNITSEIFQYDNTSARYYITLDKWNRWSDSARDKLRYYELQVWQHYQSGTPANSEKKVWTFWGALFYCGTIFTTIGYGHIVPSCRESQAATIVYAFIGIPFLLMVLADLGRLFTRAIKAVFSYIKYVCHTGKIRKARRMGRRATAVPVQYMTVAWNKMPYFMPYQNRGKKGSMDVSQPDTSDVEAGNNNEVTADKDEKTDKEKDLKNDTKEDSKKKDKKEKRKEKEKNETELEEAEALPAIVPDEVDDEFNLPVSLAIILLLAYMMLGAFIFTLWEEWTFFESFYFVFISMSTIGFGDYVPEHPIYMMATFIYLLFGLALTSMCINVIQEKLSATFEMAKLRIGTTFGLDANMFMEDDLRVDKSESPDRKGDSIKSRRGSKAVQNKSPDSEKKKDKSKSPERKENGVNEKDTLQLPENPNAND